MGAHVYLNGRMKKKKRIFNPSTATAVLMASRPNPTLDSRAKHWPERCAVSTAGQHPDRHGTQAFFQWCALKQQAIGCNLQAHHEAHHHLQFASQRRPQPGGMSLLRVSLRRITVSRTLYPKLSRGLLYPNPRTTLFFSTDDSADQAKKALGKQFRDEWSSYSETDMAILLSLHLTLVQASSHEPREPTSSARASSSPSTVSCPVEGSRAQSWSLATFKSTMALLFRSPRRLRIQTAPTPSLPRP